MYDMYSQQFTSCYCQPKAFSFVFAFKFVYVTNQVRYSLVLYHPPHPQEIVDPPLTNYGCTA